MTSPDLRPSTATSAQPAPGRSARRRSQVRTALLAAAITAAAAFGLVVTAGPAAAASCSQSSCENQSPYTTGCINGSSIIHDAYLTYYDGVGGEAEQGHVRLWYSSACRTAWATIYDIPKASQSQQDYAVVKRSDGTALFCFVPAGDTSCFTYMVNDAGYTSYAAASDYAYDGVDGYTATFTGSTGSY